MRKVYFVLAVAACGLPRPEGAAVQRQVPGEHNHFDALYALGDVCREGLRLDPRTIAGFKYLDRFTGEIVNSDEFRDALLAIPSVEAGPKRARIAGPRLYTIYAGKDQDYAPQPVCYSLGCSGGTTTGSTDMASACADTPGRFAMTVLRPVVIERVSDQPEPLACAINTVAHEWAHSVVALSSSGPLGSIGEGQMLFVDIGWKHESFGLASYTVGAVAQCVYLKRWRPELDLRACEEAVGTHSFDSCTCTPGWVDAFISGDTACGRSGDE